ncbi:endonuclease domain-containing 1 protein-like [Pseudorasbora parva]|uniref:endonuclease domain-containing 1 protein-like n=1 Tax=Pseudorasbora parva TaxID=51549 RepID=UPI00351EBB02
MFVLGLLTCIVLRAFSAQARVDEDEFKCREFFYRGTEPRGMDQNARRICQMYSNEGVMKTYYATLYSVHHRIPLYSAFIFNPDCMNDNGRSDNWHVEPQISGYETEHMVLETDLRDYNEATIKASQAMSSDYSDTGYDRGHLNPNSFSCNEGRTATFTLTNAAPMNPKFNREHWYKMERTLRTFLSNQTISDKNSATAYIVTGTVPDVNVRIPQREISDDPERVSVPSHIWTAVCYRHQSDVEKSFSFGYIGENKPEEPDINLISVSDLNDQLTDLYKRHSGTQQSVKVNVFEDDCFGMNDKSKMVQKKLIELINQKVQMSSGVQNTLGAVKKASEHNVNVREVRAKLGFGNTMAEDTLKGVSVKRHLLSYESDSCSPGSIAKNGEPCLCVCAKYGSREPWCYTDVEGNYAKCCSYDDCYSALNEKTCRSNHMCGYHGYSYLWCYTDDNNNWEYCCKNCA